MTTIRERFWAKVRRGDGCWEWTAARSAAGYGWFKGAAGPELAHRVAWRLERGEIQAGLFVLHRCDNPRCVRPDHLFLGTNADNMADMVQKGRQSRGEAIAARMRGGLHWTVRHPERIARGDRNGARTRPDRVASGDRNGMRTHPESRATGERHGSRTHPESVTRGERNGQAKLTEAALSDIRARVANGETQAALAAEYGVSRAAVCLALKGRTWAHAIPRNRGSDAANRS